MPKYNHMHQTEEHMEPEYDPLEMDMDISAQDCSEETALITVDEFYDLLMEQQEQM